MFGLGLEANSCRAASRDGYLIVASIGRLFKTIVQDGGCLIVARGICLFVSERTAPLEIVKVIGSAIEGAGSMVTRSHSALMKADVALH